MVDILAHLWDWLSSLRLMRWLILALACAGAWVLVNMGPLREYLVMRDRLQDHRDRNTRLELEHGRLQVELEGLGSGDFHAERAARERLRMSRPGERVYFIEQEPAEIVPPPDPPVD